MDSKSVVWFLSMKRGILPLFISSFLHDQPILNIAVDLRMIICRDEGELIQNIFLIFRFDTFHPVDLSSNITRL